jgi:hypothetical protein
MSRKVIFILALFLGVNIGAFAQGEYDFPIDKHDFGVVEEGVIATYEFEFTNVGTDSLMLKRENVRPSCGCTTPKLTEGKIGPKGKGKITAEYNSMGRVGTFNKTIHIFDSTNIVKTLTIKGIVIKKEEKAAPTEAELKKSAKFSIDKTENNFGKIERGQMVTYKFNVKNSGKDTLKITSAQSACSCINHKLYNKENSLITFVMPGKSAVLEITYNPQGTGKNRDVVTLFTNDLSNPRVALVLTADVVESLIEKSPVKQDGSGSPFQK